MTILFFCGGIIFAETNIELDKTIIAQSKDYSIYSYYNSGIILLIPEHKGLQTIFQAEGISAQTFLPGIEKDCAMINGFYFGRGVNGDKFQPAGPITLYQGLRKKPKIINSTTNPAEDTNLGVNITYNSINNTIGFNTSLKISYGVRFFAGPMIIEEGNINNQIYQRKSHRTSKHYRTFLIQTKEKKAIFGITTQKVTLSDLGQKIQQIYNNQSISVVNLDGGSSTALSATGYTFNTKKILPIRFSTCKK